MISRKKALVMLLVCGIILAGCQNTPQEVIQKSEGYQNNEEIKSGDMEFDTLENVKKQSVEDLKIQTQNLVLPDKISWGTMDNIYSATIKNEENFLEKKDLVTDFLGITVKKWKKSMDCGEKMLSDKHGHNIEIIDDGFIGYENKSLNQLNKSEDEKEGQVIQVFDLMKGEIGQE